MFIFNGVNLGRAIIALRKWNEAHYASFEGIAMKKLLPFGLFLLLFLTFATASRPARANSPMEFELSEMPVVEIQGDTQYIEGKNRSERNYLIYTPTQIGDGITFRIKIEESGGYDLTAMTYKTGNEGMYSMEIDGKEVSRKDYYTSNKWEVGHFNIVPGTYEVTFRYIGKNPKSNGTDVMLSTLHFWPKR